MQNPGVQLFHGDVQPTNAHLEAVCDMFRGIPVFDEANITENQETIAMRATPDDYRELLKAKTLLLVCDERDSVAGLLEWDPRDQDTVMLAYITWMLVHPQAREQGVSSLLHRHFETSCVPGVIQGVQKTVLQALSVHLNNPALKIYRHWGYSEQGAPQWNDGRRLFMVKSPAVSE